MGLLQSTNTPTPAAAKTITPLTIPSLATKPEEFPVPAYQFMIEINKAPVAFFQAVTGITAKREIDPLTEGGLNNFTREFPGHITYEHVTFEVGMTSSSFFWDWMMEGQYDGKATAMSFDLVQIRPDPSGKEIFIETKRWTFSGAFPVSWKVSDLSIEDSQKVVVESLELSFDYFSLG